LKRRDLTFIIVIAVLLLAAVSSFEMALRDVPEVPQDVEIGADSPSLSASATPLPHTAEPTQPAATAVVTVKPDDAQPATASG
jgi:hypothetical protein